MRQEIEKHKLSLAVIGLLLVLKFIVMPIIDWQNEELAKIKLLKDKQSRVERLLRNKDAIIQQNKAIAEGLLTAKKLFLETDKANDFQLGQQQWLESELKQFDISLNNIGWTNQQTLDGVQAQGYDVQLNIDGKTVNIVRFIQSLQSLPYFVEIQSFNFSFKQQRLGNLGRSRVRLNLVFYRWQEQGKIDG